VVAFLNNIVNVNWHTRTCKHAFFMVIIYVTLSKCNAEEKSVNFNTLTAQICVLVSRNFV